MNDIFDLTDRVIVVTGATGALAGSAADYLARENVICIGGSWITPSRLMQQRDWHRIHEVASRC